MRPGWKAREDFSFKPSGQDTRKVTTRYRYHERRHRLSASRGNDTMARRRLLSKYEPSTRMDATKAAALEESLRRAERAQWRFLQRQQQTGKLELTQPQVPCEQETAGSLSATQQQARDSKMVETLRNCVGIPLALTHVSTNLWAGTNPGYVFPMIHQRSANTADFACWSDAEKQLLDAQLRLDGDHRRQKNDLSEFVEASVSFMHMMKRGKGKEDDKIKK